MHQKIRDYSIVVRIVLLFILLQRSFVFSQLSEGKRITKELCSEKYFGRGYIKNGDSLAAEFLALEFQKRGLKKIKKSYFQKFEFDVNTFPGQMGLFFDEKELKPGVDYFVDPSSGPSNIEWTYKVLDKSNLFDEAFIVDLIREIRDVRNWNSLLVDTRNIVGDSLKKVKAFQEELAKICHVISITDEKFTFSVSNEQFSHSLVYVKSSFFTTGVKIRSSIEAVLKKNHHSRNVLAVFPGKKKSKKNILITAHYDHLGGMGDRTYFPGANDNASGTSMLLTVADALKSIRLKHNIVFIAFEISEWNP